MKPLTEHLAWLKIAKVIYSRVKRPENFGLCRELDQLCFSGKITARTYCKMSKRLHDERPASTWGHLFWWGWTPAEDRKRAAFALRLSKLS